MGDNFQCGTLKMLRGLTLFAGCASGQWLNYPSPGIPRLPDGNPNLTAPARKSADGKPDLSGVWTINARPYGGNIANDLKPGDVLPWAEALTKERQESLGKDNPSDIHCLPFGPRLNFFGPNFLKIVQTPTLIVILSEDLTYRQIFLDRRDLPDFPGSPRPARRPQPRFHGLLRWPLGGRHARCHHRRLQRSDVARLRRASSHGITAHDGAVPSERLRSLGADRDL